MGTSKFKEVHEINDGSKRVYELQKAVEEAFKRDQFEVQEVDGGLDIRIRLKKDDAADVLLRAVAQEAV